MAAHGRRRGHRRHRGGIDRESRRHLLAATVSVHALTDEPRWWQWRTSAVAVRADGGTSALTTRVRRRRQSVPPMHILRHPYEKDMKVR